MWSKHFPRILTTGKPSEVPVVNCTSVYKEDAKPISLISSIYFEIGGFQKRHRHSPLERFSEDYTINMGNNHISLSSGNSLPSGSITFFCTSWIEGTSKIIGAFDLNAFPIAIAVRLFNVGRMSTKDFPI